MISHLIPVDEYIGNVQNTTQPLADFTRCHCHDWRIDECPNTQVASWARAALEGRG